jgi:regulator of protease activity HflC (stomatin/prohibitin superfamily)
MNTKRSPSSSLIALLVIVLVGVGVLYELYSAFLIEVPAKYMAILVHKTGRDLDNSQSIAPSDEYKGVQTAVLTEGRYYYNPYNWSWAVVPQIEIPAGKLGVRIRLYGENLTTGELIAPLDSQKGIVPEVLYPGRYAINAQLANLPGTGRFDSGANHCAEVIELHDPVTIPAGFKGVMTLVSAKLPAKANEVVVPKGVEARGVQSETLEPGTYYLNPYMAKVSLVDCRSQRYNLEDIGFSTRDGFWVSLEGRIEFRVNPKEAAKVFVLYRELSSGGGADASTSSIDDQVIQKIIVPNTRAYTRLKGSSHSGKEFITGETRAKFQEEFQREMQSTCAIQGIEVLQALITRINPPEKIAEPVRRRQIALQQEKQYKKEISQQEAEKDLAVQKATVLQRQTQIGAEQEVVVLTVDAKRKQEVAVIDANKRLGVAQKKFEAAKDLAAATMATGKAEADVVRFQNEAQAAGWRTAIQAFNGDGAEFARYTLLKKIAPAFKAMMVNTENSTLMDVFKAFKTNKTVKEASVSDKKEHTASAYGDKN